MRSTPVVALGALLCSTAVGQDHNHITIDADGSQIVLDTGYLPDETDFEIAADGWVLFQGDRLERSSITDWVGSEFTGWQLGSETVFTSDFYTPTGRLDGGDFAFEITAFEHVSGAWESDFAWAQRDGLDILDRGVASGATRDERSFDVGFNGHPHSQVWLAERPGRYQVTFVAWDRNGVYADSDPIHFYVRAVPAPGALGLLAVGAAGVLRRRR